MARLILMTAEGTQAVELRPVNSLGRHPNNTIQLLDKIVSKEHCIIEQRGEHFWLRDLGSLNGTFINNERVRGEAPLKHGDEIALGATRGRFDDGGAPMSAAAQGAPGPGWAGAPVAPASQQAQGASPLAQSAQLMAPAYQKGAPGYPQGYGPASQQPPNTSPQQGRQGQQQGQGQQQYLHTPMAQQHMAPQQQQQQGPGGTAPLRPPGARPITGPQATSYLAHGTRVDLNDQARQIGTQIAAVEKGFLPFERIANDPVQLRADYERLRLSHELSRSIGLERDTNRLLEKILESVFKFIRADRGVIFLRDDAGELTPRASQRRDGTNAPITVSTTILNH